MPVIKEGQGSVPPDALARLHARIRACTKCEKAGYIETAQPIVAGSIRDRVMIVGQAPGAVEVVMGVPFAGRSGAVLRRWLGQAEIGEDELPYRSAITKCFPGKASMGSGDRRPSPAEIELCAPWLEEEIALLKPDVLLLVGTLAIERLWRKVPLDEAVGRSHRQGDALLIPLPHPSGASRWLNEPGNRDLLGQALALLRREVRALRRSEGGVRRPVAGNEGPLAGSQ